MNLLRTLVPTLAGMVLACASWTAQAAAAVAVAPDGSSYTALDSVDVEKAKAAAIEGCQRKGSPCKVTVWTHSARAIALAKGTNGNAQATHAKPEQARDAAMKECRRSYKACRFVALYWEPGGSWAAWATATNTGGDMVYEYFAYDQLSEPEARDAALAGCKEGIKDRTDATCKIYSRWGNWTRARASSASYISVQLANTRQEAEAAVLRACTQGSTPGDRCTLEDVIDNPGPIAAPASFARVAAQTSLEKEKALAARRPQPVQRQQALSCTNRCVNGSCLRSFPDGRTERWQAPRVFDPFKNDWKWDTSSCGG
jgi:hypothetical protein